MGKVPLYGYLKDPDDKNHLVIDPEASLIVQRVFQMKLDGVSLGFDCKQMNEEGVPVQVFCSERTFKGNQVPELFLG